MQETNLMAQSIAGLAVVLAIFAGLVWAMRRLQQNHQPKKDGQMQVIQRLHLDSKNSVVEIKHGNQHFLVGVGPSGIHRIANVSQQEDLPEVETAQESIDA